MRNYDLLVLYTDWLNEFYAIDVDPTTVVPHFMNMNPIALCGHKAYGNNISYCTTSECNRFHGNFPDFPVRIL